MFQYPLFRIELLSFVSPHGSISAFWFQYPLFRIELLSSFITQTLQLKLEVSISALSDRIAQQRACFISTVASSVSISALSDRIAQPSRRRTWIG